MYKETIVTTDEQLSHAVKCIDSVFNEDGYAKAHPELVSGFIIAASNNDIAASNNVIADNIFHFSEKFPED